MNNNSFENLEVWQRSMKLVVECYRLLDSVELDNDRVLRYQVRKSVISNPSNIAEGAASGSPRNYHRFLNHSTGSAAELVTQLKIAEQLGFIGSAELSSIFESLRIIQAQLHSLKRSIRSRHGLKNGWE
ncbi:four helix bundle protein [Sanyastnella coralliicola]|uniref:four helix bundle protein n=1 Tax=Sanyastnella coralliicola TaxID=3069118 RepID=UPI0027BA9396|nr:four helix bundle protein [Longitalea sp. SCSIO 12813]